MMATGPEPSAGALPRTEGSHERKEKSNARGDGPGAGNGDRHHLRYLVVFPSGSSKEPWTPVADHLARRFYSLPFLQGQRGRFGEGGSAPGQKPLRRGAGPRCPRRGSGSSSVPCDTFCVRRDRSAGAVVLG